MNMFEQMPFSEKYPVFRKLAEIGDRIFNPAKSYPSPSEVVSVTSMKRMNLCNDVHDSICLLSKPNSLKENFFLQINATSATSHLNPLIINE